MKYAIFGDIHGNLEALEAVLEKCAQEKPDKYICTGDIVGYGADPVACIDKILALKPIIVAGNHDFAAVGILNTDFFNHYAFQAIEWTRNQLPPKYRDFLGKLRLVEKLNGLTIVHSTLYNPELFEYIQTNYDVQLGFSNLDGNICFIGHSHVPVSFVLQRGSFSFSTEPFLPVTKEIKVIANIGSVGQPRDDNPAAAYAIYDDAEGIIWIKRIEYDVEKASDKIKKAKLPEILAERIKYGR
ncbi:MAG: metallophosphoesterase [Planctomycetota bacterium]